MKFPFLTLYLVLIKIVGVLTDQTKMIIMSNIKCVNHHISIVISALSTACLTKYSLAELLTRSPRFKLVLMWL